MMLAAAAVLAAAIVMLTVVAFLALRAAVRLRAQVDTLERQLARARRPATGPKMPTGEVLQQITTPTPHQPPVPVPVPVPVRVVPTDTVGIPRVADFPPTSGGLDLPWLDDDEDVSDHTRPIRKPVRADVLTRRLLVEQKRAR